METLAPRSAYTRAEHGIQQHVALGAGLFFGTFTGMVELVKVIVEGGSFGAAARGGLLELVLGGVLFGLLFGTGSWLSDQRRMDRVHAGDAKVVAPPPPGALFRLPCGLVRGRFVISGVLYLGAWGMRFEPHRRTRKGYRDALVMEPLEAIEIERADVRLPSLMRIWGPDSPGFVVRWPGGSADFLAPEAAKTCGRLHAALASLRQDAPVTSGAA